MIRRTCQWIVSGGSASRAAISSVLRPSAIRRMISTSRGESCGTFCAMPDVTRGSTYDPPAAMRSIAPTRVGHRPVLEHVAARAAVEGALQQIRVALAGVEDHAEAGPAAEHLPREVDPAPVGEIGVDERHVRLGAGDEIRRRREAGGAADDVEAVAAEERGEALTERVVIVHDDHAGHGGLTVLRSLSV